MVLGKLEDFLSTSCIASLSFLDNTEEGDPDNLCHSVKDYLEKELQKPFIKTLNRSFKSSHGPAKSRRSGVAGIIKRTRSIQVDQYDPGTSIEPHPTPRPLSISVSVSFSNLSRDCLALISSEFPDLIS